jgi:hypothetical protein
MEHLRLIATWLRRVVSAKVSDWRMNAIKDFESSLTIFPAWSTISKGEQKANTPPELFSSGAP